jgi:signal transduction histidine kinase
MPERSRANEPSALRLRARVGLGVLAGIGYAALDRVLDATRAQSATLLAVAALHQVVDLVLPIVAGALLGMASHYLAIRAGLARAEAQRADDLRARLNKVERDQAVWVVAASMLHEVRTPLHALGLLLDDIAALPPDAEAERAAVTERARAQIDRLLEHVGALKQLPGAAKPDLPGVDLAAIAARYVDALAPIVREESIELRLGGSSTPTLARGNPAYVEIVLENLVENALEALRERGGPGRIDVEVARDDGHATLRVRDDGPGVDPAVGASVFEPLRTTKSRGLGIGLSIARALSRAMKGDLVLEEGAGARTTFRLELEAEKR